MGRVARALRLCTLGWAEVLVRRLGAGSAPVTVNRVVLIWKLARMDILTARGLDGLIRIPRLPDCCAARLGRPA